MSDAIWMLLPIIAVGVTAVAVGWARNLPLPEIPPPAAPPFDPNPPPRRVICSHGHQLVEPTREEMYRFEVDQWRLTQPGRYVRHEEHRAFIDEHRKVLGWVSAMRDVERGHAVLEDAQ